MLLKRIRKTDIDANIKRLKWLFLSLLIIAVFGIVVFLNFRGLTKDVSISDDYYAAIELDSLELKDSLWAHHKDTFNPAYAEAFEEFRANTNGTFLEKAHVFMDTNQVERMTFQTLQAPETVVFDLSREGSGKLKTLVDRSITGFLGRAVADQQVSQDVATTIKSQQVIFFVTVRTIGRRTINREFLYTNGRYSSHDTDGLRWQNGNQFRFPHRLDVANTTPIPNSAQQLKNATTELVRQRTSSGDDHRAQYLALVGLKERQVAKLPVVGVEIPIPEALTGAAVLATIYINLVLAALSSLGPMQIRRSTEPWFLIDISEPNRAQWQRAYRVCAFVSVACVHILVYASPILLIVLAWMFASEPLAYAVGALSIFTILGTLGSCFSFLRFAHILLRLSMRQQISPSISAEVD